MVKRKMTKMKQDIFCSNTFLPVYYLAQSPPGPAYIFVYEHYINLHPGNFTSEESNNIVTLMYYIGLEL